MSNQRYWIRQTEVLHHRANNFIQIEYFSYAKHLSKYKFIVETVSNILYLKWDIQVSTFWTPRK